MHHCICKLQPFCKCLLSLYLLIILLLLFCGEVIGIKLKLCPRLFRSRIPEMYCYVWFLQIQSRILIVYRLAWLHDTRADMQPSICGYHGLLTTHFHMSWSQIFIVIPDICIIRVLFFGDNNNICIQWLSKAHSGASFEYSNRTVMAYRTFG